jgi:hypothetical protein
MDHGEGAHLDDFISKVRVIHGDRIAIVATTAVIMYHDDVGGE